MSNTMKKCFVITPIGDSNTEIRRHIDGIIDQAIFPAIGDKYDIEVAHRKYEVGSINDRVIRSIYESELVIANLTTLNPNVMFELAIRYSFGKPAIVIAEKGTKLPFDIVDENTIFYINDPGGANELKEEIVKYENNIEYNEEKKYGPIYKVIKTIPLYNDIESGTEVSNTEMMSYIVSRLESLESMMANTKGKNSRQKFVIQVTYNENFIESKQIFDVELDAFLTKYWNDILTVMNEAGEIKIYIKDTVGGKRVLEIIDGLHQIMQKFCDKNYNIIRTLELT